LPRKILIITPFHLPNIGGAESFVDGLEEAAKKWFDVTTLTFQPFEGKAQKYEEYYYKRGSLRIHRIGWPIRHGRLWQGFGLINALIIAPRLAINASLLALHGKYDIVHAQGLISAFVGVWLKKIFKIKLFVTLLALYDFNERTRVFKWLVRFTLRQCDTIFVEGKNGRKDIEKLVSKKKIVIFNHWVNQDIFKPGTVRCFDKIRVLYIGRAIPIKGRHIIEGAERLLNNPKYEFTYVENTPFKDLPKLYQDHHIVCVPSLYSEGYSRVVAEAVSCGCHVISSNRGSLPEMIEMIGEAIEPTARNFAKQIEYETTILQCIDEVSLGFAKDNFNQNNSRAFLNEYTNA